MVTVVGVGPGSSVFLSAAAWEQIRSADLLVGSARALKPFKGLGKETLTVTGDISHVLDEVERLQEERQIAVLVSGDPGLFSLLAPLRRRLGRHRLNVIPGVAVAQLLFARLALSWDGVTFISLHGRKNGRALGEVARAQAPVCIYTDESWPPSRVAKVLLEAGRPHDSQAVVGMDLSYESERIVETTLAGLAAYDGNGLHIVYVPGTDGE